MNFAVVEYSSKTKQIWRHSDARPNYVCDPIKEIDPTSFGCYVSALKGEHIPLTYFMPGVYRKIIKRFTGSWPSSYDMSYFEKFDTLLVVYQLSDGHEMVNFLKKLRATYPNIAILGVPTQPYGILKDVWDNAPEKKQEIIQFIQQCDIFLTIVESTKDAWQEIAGNIPVAYLPQPYPVEFASEKFKTRNNKRNIIYVAGVTDRKNIILGEVVAKKLQEKFPHYRIQMSAVEGMELDISELQGTQYDIIPFTPWQEHLEMLSKAMLVINTDYTFTRGRVQVDCAAVGTPSIGANSDGQDDLFPKLPATDATALEQLVLQGTQLLQDDSYYSEVVRTAQERLKKYSYPESKKRLEELVATIHHE